MNNNSTNLFDHDLYTRVIGNEQLTQKDSLCGGPQSLSKPGTPYLMPSIISF